MDIRKISDQFFVFLQISKPDLTTIQKRGIRSIICNRPDGEGADQPAFEELARTAGKLGLEMRQIPVSGGLLHGADVHAFTAEANVPPGQIHTFWRTGTRSATLWSVSQSRQMPLADNLRATKAAGYDMKGVVRRIANGGTTPADQADACCDLVIVGAGASGIAVAASLKARNSGLYIGLIDPADAHYNQPGWTMVGGGIFDAEDTVRTLGSLIPKGVHWRGSAVAAFEPEKYALILDGYRVLRYKRRVEPLGRNGVSSSYRCDLAPYTWELVSGLTSGRAFFAQPVMPVKCAGAPQKANYLSTDHWIRNGVINGIDIEFHNACGALFAIKDYVLTLQRYVDKYRMGLNFFYKFVAIDGPARKASWKWTNRTNPCSGSGSILI